MNISPEMYRASHLNKPCTHTFLCFVYQLKIWSPSNQSGSACQRWQTQQAASFNFILSQKNELSCHSFQRDSIWMWVLSAFIGSVKRPHHPWVNHQMDFRSSRSRIGRISSPAGSKRLTYSSRHGQIKPQNILFLTPHEDHLQAEI